MTYKSWVIDSNHTLHMLDLYRSNCYLVECIDGSTATEIDNSNKKYYLIDAGIDWEREKIDAELKRLGAEKLEAVLVTHPHYDHIGNLAYFQRKFNCTVYVSPKGRNSAISGKTTIAKGSRFLMKLSSIIANRLPQFTRVEPIKSDAADKVKDAIEGMKIDNFEIYVLETPGHTADSLCFIIGSKSASNRIGVVGDTLIDDKRYGVYPPYVAEPQNLLISWKKLLDSKCVEYPCGHGRVIPRSLLQSTYDELMKN